MSTPAISPIADQPPALTAATPARKALFWDRIARKYAADPIADLAGYEATLLRVQAFLSDKHDALEIGCGTGSTALRLAPFVRRWYATDVSTAMIAIAKEKLAAQPMPQLTFALADADAPGFGQSTYDIALAFNVLHLVGDLDATLAVAARALRPGGLLITKTPCIAEMNLLIPYALLPLMRAVGKAPHVLCFNGDHLQAAITRQDLDVLSVERHGTRGKDIRAFIVARKPA